MQVGDPGDRRPVEDLGPICGEVVARRREQVLHVGARLARVAAPEAADLGDRRGGRAGAGQQPLSTVEERAQQPCLHIVGLAVDPHGLADPGMVLHVLAHAGEVMANLDAVLAEVGFRPDAGQHQELRRAEGAGAEDDGLGGGCLPALAAPEVVHADDARALEPESQRLRVGHDTQVVAALGRPEVGARRAVPPAPALGGLDVAHAHLRRCVDVLAEGHARLDAGLDQDAGERMQRADVGDGKRPARAPVLVGAALEVFQAAEIGEHVLEVPAAAAERRPAVIVLGRTPHVGGGVDRAGAAQHLAARHVILAPAAGGIGLGHEAPVVARVGDAVEHGARRHQDDHAAVRAAGLQQQHPVAPVFREPRGDHAAAGARADDDIVRLMVRPHRPDH